MMHSTYLIIGIFCALAIAACEEPFVPDVVAESPKIVVEGYIEAGEGSLPAYVVLSKSLSFFQEVDAEGLNNSFIRNALVQVSDGDQKVTLTQVCLSQLPPELRGLVGLQFGLDPDSTAIDFCAYFDVQDALHRESGRSYDLYIDTGEEELTATTTIPEFIELDSIWFEEPPGEPTDTLAQMWIRVTDPAGVPNFYRYQNAINGSALITPFQSVGDDKLFDGNAFDIPLQKAEPRGADFDADTFGLFTRGDTVLLKWCLIDEAHFNFWETLEAAVINQGPFSSYTRIDHNVEGGVGIWGGYAVRYYNLIVPE